MSLTIFYSEKTLFQPIKSRSSKSRKIHIFPKGLAHSFGPKMAIFPTFFKAIQARKICFTIFQNKKKTLFQTMKTRSSKSGKFDFFAKGLTDGFGPKMAIFPPFIFQEIQPRKMSFRIFQNKKNAFVGYKNKKFKKSKN